MTLATGTARRRFVPPEPPRTPKSASTRRRLLDAAARLFIARGYDPVSMRDIAAAAHVTKGALYGHFRSKGQLLVEVIRSQLAARDQERDFEAAAADPDTGVRLMYDDGGRDVRLLEVDAAAVARHDDDVAAGLADLYADRHARIRDALSETRDPDTAAWLLGALSGGIGMKESAGAPRPGDDRLAAAIVAALRGLS